jgi:1-deoxy-D-xylulose-5-phosphate reductoisomerase
MGYAMAYPDRLDFSYGAIDWSELKALEFELPDWDAFPCLGLAYTAGRCGDTAPAWLNASNEIAVEAFLAGKLSWAGIAEVLDAALSVWPGGPADTVEAVLDADQSARLVAASLVEARL